MTEKENSKNATTTTMEESSRKFSTTNVNPEMQKWFEATLAKSNRKRARQHKAIDLLERLGTGWMDVPQTKFQQLTSNAVEDEDGLPRRKRKSKSTTTTTTIDESEEDLDVLYFEVQVKRAEKENFFDESLDRRSNTSQSLDQSNENAKIPSPTTTPTTPTAADPIDQIFLNETNNSIYVRIDGEDGDDESGADADEQEISTVPVIEIESSAEMEKIADVEEKVSSPARIAKIYVSPATPNRHRTPPSSTPISAPPVNLLVDYRAKHVKQILFIHPDNVRQYSFFLESSQFINRFLRFDYCNRISDSYLLAVVFVYFCRSTLPEYTEEDFFKFLYLANETFEDEEMDRESIIASIYDKNSEHYMEQRSKFLQGRLVLWKKLNFETIVARETLDQFFEIDPNNPIWARERAVRHAGANRKYKPIYECVTDLPNGCHETPIVCPCCISKLPKSALPTKLRTVRNQLRLPFKKQERGRKEVDRTPEKY